MADPIDRPSANRPVEEAEVERKYDVGPHIGVPDLTRLAGVSSAAPPLELHQVATYFDTADLRLLRARITLRRRVGGVDDGWHLKLPSAGDARREVRLPPGDDGSAVPGALLDRIADVFDGSAVAPTAVLRTHRTLHRLLDGDGRELAELCDDRVTAETTAGEVTRWREWEFELAAGPRGLLDDAEPLLLAAGARPAAVGSKIARVLSSLAPSDERP